MTDARWRGRRALPVAAPKADRSHWPNIRFFRYLILTNRKCARDDRGSACVTRVSGEVKVLFFHEAPKQHIEVHNPMLRFARLQCLITIALLVAISTGSAM